MRKFLVVLLSLVMILPMFSVAVPMSVSAAMDTSDAGFDMTGQGSDWSDYYYESEKLMDKVPHTFAVWVKTASTSNQGVVIGNYVHMSDSDAHINVGIYKNGCPRLNWNDEDGTAHEALFEGAPLTVGEWAYVVFVHDDANKAIHYYLNGEFVESNTADYSAFEAGAATDFPFALGGDLRPLNGQYFKGEIGNISFYADARTADEIKSDYTNGADLTDKDLILHYELSSADNNSTKIEDKSGNGYHQIRGKMWLTEEEMQALRGDTSDRAYSFAVVGDTQCLVYYPTTEGAVGTIYDWIVDNKESKNIQYVIGLGDITEYNTVAEWEEVKPAITKMDGVVEYSLIRGNHDVLKGDDPTLFNQYFASHKAYVDQFEKYGGFYEEGSVENTYRTMRIGNTDYLFLNIDYAPTDDILNWACSVIETYPEHKVIISTHLYMYCDSTTIDDDDVGSVPDETTQNNGDDIWSKVVSRYENVQMVLSGHIISDHIRVRQEQGIHGNTVTQMLIDGQRLDKVLADDGGVGMVAMFYFDETGENVSVEYYSTVKDLYLRSWNQFDLCLTAEVEQEQTAAWDGSSMKTPSGFGTEDDPYIISSAENLVWMARQIGIGDAPGNTVRNPFEGKYFKQVCDIDLGGHELPSIGYYYATTAKMFVFGGTYDGGGYSIKNGSIINTRAFFDKTLSAHNQNAYFGTGLFGVIHGATIRNVVMENMKINDYASFGLLVGVASAPVTETADFNVIENCTVKESCAIESTYTASSKIANYHWNNGLPAHVGSMVGMGGNITIRNCVNKADITTSGNHTYAGGIIGLAMFNSEIVGCTNEGDISLDFNITGVTRKAAVPHINGGIVGAISGTAGGGTDYITFISTGVTIMDCTNSGSFSISGTAVGPVYYGGILGFSNELGANTTHTISSCKNSNTSVSLGTQTALTSVAGIVGNAYHAADATSVSTLYVEDCTSVDLTADSLNLGTAYTATNEYVTAVVNDGITLPITVLDHTYGEWQKHDSTQHKRVCTCGCGEIKYADHIWGSGVQTVAPTHTSVGTMTYTCIVCGEIKTEDIAKTTVHTGFGAWVNNGDGTHTSTCVCGTARTHAHNKNNYGYCVDCQINIVGSSVNLGADLSMKYYVNVMDTAIDAAKLKMQFTFNGAMTSVSCSDTDTNGYYVFVLEGITPQCMGDNIKAELLLDNDTIASKDTYSIEQNLRDLLAIENAKAETERNTALITLINDTLTYGAAAQTYRGYNTTALVNKDITGSEWTTLTETDKVVGDSSSATTKFTAAGVRFADVNRLYFRFVTDENVANVKVEIIPAGGTASTVTSFTFDDGVYTVYSEGIFATDFDTVYTVNLIVNDSTVQTLTYSVKSYVHAMQDSATMGELAKALYNYGLAAEAYAETLVNAD
ncbi:MAG: metallophosphoesterase [Clostridia bacterium]|nr:metallophosphoesterase [Clostridia bacterium]